MNIPIDFSLYLSEARLNIFNLIAQGYTNPEIAVKLNLSIRTVEHHSGFLLAKFNVQRREHLILMALGVIPLPEEMSLCRQAIARQNREDILQMHQEGMSARAIASKKSLSREWVHEVIRKYSSHPSESPTD